MSPLIQTRFLHWITEKRGSLLLFLLCALFITGYWLPRNWSFYGGADWDLTYAQFEAARQSIVNYGQFPLWNPWMSFGSDLMANPQSGHLSIFFIPILLFGTFYGYKISIIAALIIGFTGAFALFKKLNPDKTIAFFLALAFGSSTYFAAHIFTGGHSNTLYVYLLPWLLYCLLQAKGFHNIFYLVIAELILVQTIIGGAPLVFILSGILCVQWAVFDFLKTRKIRFLLSVVLLFPAAIFLSLWKILPGIILWSETPRLVSDSSGISLVQWFQSLGGFETRTATWHAWLEYTLGFDIVLLGILWFYRKNIRGKWWHIALILLPVVWLCLGNFPHWTNPWYWLNHYVPIFNSLRAPSRFGIVLVLELYIALAVVLRNVSDNKWVYAVLLFAALSRMLSFSATASFYADSEQMNPSDVVVTQNNLPPRPLVVKGSDTKRQFLHILYHEPVQNAYEPLFLTPVFDTLRTMITGGGFKQFSPNKMTIKPTSKTVVLNTRYSRFWALEGKGELKYRSGLLSVKNPGDEITLTYRNPWILRGLWGILLAIPLIWLAYQGFRRKD